MSRLARLFSMLVMLAGVSTISNASTINFTITGTFQPNLPSPPGAGEPIDAGGFFGPVNANLTNYAFTIVGSYDPSGAYGGNYFTAPPNSYQVFDLYDFSGQSLTFFANGVTYNLFGGYDRIDSYKSPSQNTTVFDFQSELDGPNSAYALDMAIGGHILADVTSPPQNIICGTNNCGGYLRMQSSGRFDLLNLAPAEIAFSASAPPPPPVPEPEAWTLQLLGFFAIGGILRRRRVSGVWPRPEAVKRRGHPTFRRP